MITAFLMVFLVLPFLVVPDPEHLQDPGPFLEPTVPFPSPIPLLHPVHGGPGAGQGSGTPTTPSAPTATDAPHPVEGSSGTGSQQPWSQGQVAQGGVHYNRPGYQRRVRELLVPSHLDFKRHDQNHDGVIDNAELQEFCVFLNHDFETQGRVQADLGRSFDSDHSGALSEEEWRGFIAMEGLHYISHRVNLVLVFLLSVCAAGGIVAVTQATAARTLVAGVAGVVAALALLNWLLVTAGLLSGILLLLPEAPIVFTCLVLYTLTLRRGVVQRLPWVTDQPPPAPSSPRSSKGARASGSSGAAATGDVSPVWHMLARAVSWTFRAVVTARKSLVGFAVQMTAARRYSSSRPRQ